MILIWRWIASVHIVLVDHSGQEGFYAHQYYWSDTPTCASNARSAQFSSARGATAFHITRCLARTDIGALSQTVQSVVCGT